jgi:hypothetical protein
MQRFKPFGIIPDEVGAHFHTVAAFSNNTLVSATLKEHFPNKIITRSINDIDLYPSHMYEVC